MVRKQRRLPVAGDMLVRIGSRVEPDDIVARASIPGTPLMVDVAGPLGVQARRPGNACWPAASAARWRRATCWPRGARASASGSRVKSPVAGTLTGL